MGYTHVGGSSVDPCGFPRSTRICPHWKDKVNFRGLQALTRLPAFGAPTPPTTWAPPKTLATPGAHGSLTPPHRAKLHPVAPAPNHRSNLLPNACPVPCSHKKEMENEKVPKPSVNLIASGLKRTSVGCQERHLIGKI